MSWVSKQTKDHDTLNTILREVKALRVIFEDDRWRSTCDTNIARARTLELLVVLYPAYTWKLEPCPDRAAWWLVGSKGETEATFRSCSLEVNQSSDIRLVVHEIDGLMNMDREQDAYEASRGLAAK